MPNFLSNLPALYLLQAHAEAAGEQGLWHAIVESNIINVLIVLAVLAYFIKAKNLFGGVDVQREKIASEIESVEKRKREALAQLEEAKRRTANLNAEVEGILKDARVSAEALSAQILADARTESGKIVDNAKRRVELEQRAAIKELERRLLNEALSDARSELAQNLNPSDQRRSVEAFLDELSEVKGAGR